MTTQASTSSTPTLQPAGQTSPSFNFFLHLVLPFLGALALMWGFSVVQPEGTLAGYPLFLLMAALLVGAIGSGFYAKFIESWHTHSWVWILLLLSGQPWFEFVCNLMDAAGLKSFKSLWYLVLIIFPGVILFSLNWKKHLQQLPWLPWMVAYCVLMLGYYFFFQEELIDPRANAGGNSLGYQFVVSQFYNLCWLVFGSQLFLNPLTLQQRWSLLTRPFLWSAIALAGLAVFAITTGWGTLDDLGTTRVMTIFEHPAHLANALSVMLLFLIRSYFLKFHHPSDSFGAKGLDSSLLLIAAVGFGTIGMMLSFSKTSIALFAAAALLLVLGGAFAISRVKVVLRSLALMAVVGILATLILEFSGLSLLEPLTKRFAEQGSIDWRNRVADYLMDDVTLQSFLVGNGMSAAKVKMSMMEGVNFSKEKAGEFSAVVIVHNGYLSQFYDYGLVGLMPFFLIAALGVFATLQFFKRGTPIEARLNYMTLMALIFYFMGVAAFDTIYEVRSPLLWFLMPYLLLEARYYGGAPVFSKLQEKLNTYRDKALPSGVPIV
jgi:hypothetical protein